MSTLLAHRPAPAPPVPGSYLGRLAKVVASSPERAAFRLKTPEGYRKVSYREVFDQARGVAAGLRAMGLQTDERVAIISENRPEWVIAYLAIWMAGGVVVPLDPQISAAEWRRLLDDSESRAVFVSGLHLPKLEEALAGSSLAERVICFDGAGHGLDLAGLARGAGGEGDDLTELPERGPEDTVVIIYTSGTTGKPKGVMLSE